jgi:hypothetical protein
MESEDKRRKQSMLSRLLRLTIAGLLLLPVSAESRSLSSGITVTLRTPAGPGMIVCTGFCPHLDLTVWEDGRILVNGGDRRISKDEAAQFQRILLPFRPAGRLAAMDVSTVLPNSCTIKIKWPADRSGAQSVRCGTFDLRGIDPLPDAVMQALQSIHVSVVG